MAGTRSPTCIASSGDNDYWPKALDFGALYTLGDYIDAPGKARWYKFSITPGQKVQERAVQGRGHAPGRRRGQGGQGQAAVLLLPADEHA